MLISRFISFIFLSTSIALIIFSLYQLFPDFENIVSLPIWALPILDAYPFSKNAQKIMLMEVHIYSVKARSKAGNI